MHPKHSAPRRLAVSRHGGVGPTARTERSRREWQREGGSAQARAFCSQALTVVAAAVRGG